MGTVEILASGRAGLVPAREPNRPIKGQEEKTRPNGIGKLYKKGMRGPKTTR